ncbi:MAG: flagellar biosynthetic protein FliO [Pseudomonadota bacterium]
MPLSVIAAEPTSPSPTAGLFQVLMGLFVVLGLMVAAVWLLKRFGPKQLSNRAVIRVVGGVSLGGRERIVVVETGDQWIVVGVAPGRVNALTTMPRQEATDITPESTRPANNFADWLKQTIEKRNAK